MCRAKAYLGVIDITWVVTDQNSPWHNPTQLVIAALRRRQAPSPAAQAAHLFDQVLLRLLSHIPTPPSY